MAKTKHSEPVYGVKYAGEMMVPMRDGVHLAVEVFIPETKGKFPALVANGMWIKELSSDMQDKYPLIVSPQTTQSGH